MLAFCLDLIALEGYLGMVLDIKKVRAPQMVIAFLYSGPNVPSIDLHVNRRVARALRIKLQRAVNILEVSTDVSHHHVPGAKLSRGVPRLESPFSHHPLPRNLKYVGQISQRSIAAYRRRR